MPWGHLVPAPRLPDGGRGFHRIVATDSDDARRSDFGLPRGGGPEGIRLVASGVRRLRVDRALGLVFMRRTTGHQHRRRAVIPSARGDRRLLVRDARDGRLRFFVQARGFGSVASSVARTGVDQVRAVGLVLRGGGGVDLGRIVGLQDRRRLQDRDRSAVNQAFSTRRRRPVDHLDRARRLSRPLDQDEIRSVRGALRRRVRAHGVEVSELGYVHRLRYVIAVGPWIDGQRRPVAARRGVGIGVRRLVHLSSVPSGIDKRR